MKEQVQGVCATRRSHGWRDHIFGQRALRFPRFMSDVNSRASSLPLLSSTIIFGSATSYHVGPNCSKHVIGVTIIVHRVRCAVALKRVFVSATPKFRNSSRR